ncbi:MAG: NUDIX domain-containing protein [Dehalococcoidales bacterium]|nr:NUDIX domain-containing protein [Dehalococcoidales bacterium]
MSRVSKRRRGTAIIETEKGILVTAGHNGIFLLPGGGANKGETRLQAAIRELKEETGLDAYYAKYLFRHVGKINKSHGHGYFQDHHTVCLIKANGSPTPRHEIRFIAYYKPGSGVRVSGTTRDIIERYYSYKKRSRVNQKKTSIISKILEWLT